MIRMPALGNAGLVPGACWDARKEMAGPQLFLTVPAVDTYQLPRTSYKVEVDNTFAKRVSNMDMSLSLSMSFMAGALTVKGSAE
jgi:hypothetical protein